MGDKFSEATLKIIQFNGVEEIEMLTNNTLTEYLNDQSRYTKVE